MSCESCGYTAHEERMKKVAHYSSYATPPEQNYMSLRTKEGSISKPGFVNGYFQYKNRDNQKLLDLNTIHGEAGPFNRGMYSRNPLPPHYAYPAPGHPQVRDISVNYVFGQDTSVHTPWSSRYSHVSNYPNYYGHGNKPGNPKC